MRSRQLVITPAGVVRHACDADELFKQLRSGLSATASFWTDHQYFEPETPFFSYFYHLVGPLFLAVQQHDSLCLIMVTMSLHPCLHQNVVTT